MFHDKISYPIKTKLTKITCRSSVTDRQSRSYVSKRSSNVQMRINPTQPTIRNNSKKKIKKISIASFIRKQHFFVVVRVVSSTCYKISENKTFDLLSIHPSVPIPSHHQTLFYSIHLHFFFSINKNFARICAHAYIPNARGVQVNGI